MFSRSPWTQKHVVENIERVERAEGVVKRLSIRNPTLCGQLYQDKHVRQLPAVGLVDARACGDLTKTVQAAGSTTSS